MTPDQLLDRMLAFANSPECPKDKRIALINSAYNTWSKSAKEANPFKFDYVKGERFTLKDCLKWGFYPEKIQNLDISLQANKVRKVYEKKKKDQTKNEHKNKQVINIETKEVYKSAKIAAIVNNINAGTLGNYLRNKRPNITNFVYLSEYEDIL